MRNELMTNISRSFNKFGFTVKKHSPELLLGAGIIGVVTSAVMACKATTKVEGILAESKKNVELAHNLLEDPDVPAEKYSEEDCKKDLVIIYTKTAVKLAKNYAPAISLGALSIASILASHNIMNKRNVAIGAAYAAVSDSFKNYRSNVVNRFGEELDRELKYNLKSEEIEETSTNEDGTEIAVKKTVPVVNDNNTLTGSEFARFFDEFSNCYSRDWERNKKFLLDQQRWANDKLKAKGYLFLNEVYEMLGMRISKAGRVVGWVYDPNNSTLSNNVDFGIFNLYREENRLFVNGYERSILLDFNVDGNVYDLLGYDKED